MSQVTHLAAGALFCSGDRLSIELHQPARQSWFRHGGLASETFSHRTHTQSVSSVGGRNGPHLGRGLRRNWPRRSGTADKHSWHRLGA